MGHLNNKLVFNVEPMPLAMMKCTRITQNNQRKQIFKSKSVLKKRKSSLQLWPRDSGVFVGFPSLSHRWCIFLVLLLLPYLSECQYSTRDPRWYSREGDYNYGYQWPNPGDPEYR